MTSFDFPFLDGARLTLETQLNRKGNPITYITYVPPQGMTMKVKIVRIVGRDKPTFKLFGQRDRWISSSDPVNMLMRTTIRAAFHPSTPMPLEKVFRMTESSLWNAIMASAEKSHAEMMAVRSVMTS